MQEIIDIQETASWLVPIDSFTACGDLWELVSGMRGVPQDKQQRLYILALREARVRGALRHWFKIPTESMVSDALTKVMVSRVLYELLTSGTWTPWRTTAKPVLVRKIRRIWGDHSERDLVDLAE